MYHNNNGYIIYILLCVKIINESTSKIIVNNSIFIFLSNIIYAIIKVFYYNMHSREHQPFKIKVIIQFYKFIVIYKSSL